MTDIFLSYNREDQATARLYAEAFSREGFDVWWDVTLRSGEAYDEVTEAALRGAKAVVVLWSPRSVVSRWVRAEATIADRCKTFVPVMIEACERPIMFELTQTAELSHWTGDAQDKAWLALLADVRRFIGQVPGTAAPPAPIATAAKSGVPFVAVLPLSCRAGDDELELAAEDLTDEITAELSHDGFCRVIASGTMAAWRGRQIDHRSLGQELDARYVIDGKVQRMGGKLRLTLQLIDPETTGMLWTEKYVLSENDSPDQREDMVGGIGAHLGELILHQEAARATKMSAGFTAWDRLMRVIAHSVRVTIDIHRLALAEAREAVALAPDFGLAQAFLAAQLALRAFFAYPFDEDLHVEVRDAIKRAFALDGDNPAVLRSLSQASLYIGDGEQALKLAERAVKLHRFSTHGYNCLAGANLRLGRTAETIAAVEQQERLAPHDGLRFNSLMFLGAALAQEGRFDEAIAAFDRSLALHPTSPYTLLRKAIACESAGQNALARAVFCELRAAVPQIDIDQHAATIQRSRQDKEHAARDVAILRHLWAETEAKA